MASDLEKALFAMAEQLKQQASDTKKFLEFIEKLTDANNALGNTHKLLMPVIQKVSEYLTNLPDLMNDIVGMSQEVRLFMENIHKVIVDIDSKFDELKEMLDKNGQS